MRYSRRWVNGALKAGVAWFEVAPKYDDNSDEFVQELDASTGFASASRNTPSPARDTSDTRASSA